MKKNLLFLALALFMLIFPSKSKAQDNSIGVNLPSLLFGNLNFNYSHKIDDKWTVNLQAQAKILDFKTPFSLGIINFYKIGTTEWENEGWRPLVEFGLVDHSQNVLIQPGVRYWMRGVYNRGFFFGGNAIAGIFKVGGDRLERSFSKGLTLGLGTSAGYSYPLSTSWNIETELGIGFVYSKFNRVYPGQKEESFFSGEINKFYIIPSRISFSVVYLF